MNLSENCVPAVAGRATEKAAITAYSSSEGLMPENNKPGRVLHLLSIKTLFFFSICFLGLERIKVQNDPLSGGKLSPAAPLCHAFC